MEQQQQATNDKIEQKPKKHQKHWVFHRDHDIAVPGQAGMIVLRERRPEEKWSYPDYRVMVHRIVMTQVKTGKMITTQDGEGNDVETPELEARFDAVHSGHIGRDEIRIGDIDPMKVYEALALIKAEHDEAVKDWELRRSCDRGAVTHRMKIPRNAAPMPEPRKRDREANRAKQGRKAEQPKPTPAPKNVHLLDQYRALLSSVL